MRALKISLRLAKFLWKVMLGLLLVLISAIAIIHLPPVQKQITRAVSNYLSSRIEAKVYIQRIHFSILGHVILEDLTVWNRDGGKILSIHQIEVSSSIFNLVTGDLIFDTIRIVGLKGQLIQDKDGLNIQFILDAFQTDATQTSAPMPVKLQFKNVQLENINFEFKSISSGITVVNQVGMLIIQGGEYSTDPNTIQADHVFLQGTDVDILSRQLPEAPDISTSIADSTATPSGIVITVMGLEVDDTNFSFHQNEVINTPKFDPAHLTLQDIKINLSAIHVGVGKDTVGTILKSLSVRLPGITVSDAAATDLRWSPNQLVASDLHVSTNASKLEADFNGWYEGKSGAADNANLEIDASGLISPHDLSYFLSDSLTQYFSHWESTDVTIEGHYTHRKGELKTLTLKTGTSLLQASGKIGDALNLETIYWNDLAIAATIGSDFERTLTPFLRGISTPSGMSMQLKSSGNSKKARMDGKVVSPWGDVTVDGTMAKPAENFTIDLNLTGQQVELGQWVNVSALGPLNFTLNATGLLSQDTNIEVDGTIHTMKLMDQSIHDIDIQSRIGKSNATVNLQTDDPNYRSKIYSEISFAGPVTLVSDATVDGFHLGELLNLDSTLSLSGDLKLKVIADQSSVESYAQGDTLLFQNHTVKYVLDSMNFYAQLSPTGSKVEYHSDQENGTLTSNFDILNSPELIQTRLASILKGHNHIPSTGNKTIAFTVALENSKLPQLLGMDVDDFSSLQVIGEIDEQKQTSSLHATSKGFKGYGISLDTLTTDLALLGDSINATLTVKNLTYNSVQLGDLNFDVLTQGDSAVSNLQLSNDTTTILGLRTRILPTDSGTFIYPDKLRALGIDYSIDSKNPVFVSSKNVAFHQFQITRQDMHMMLDGDFKAFDVSLQHVDLTPLNFLLSSDTTIINQGYLSGKISYALLDQQLNINARVDSLRLYNSEPLTLAATAVTSGKQVPFEFLLTNVSNKFDLKGQYNFANTEVDADLQLDINNPELFAFLISGVVDDMTGTITGETKITGPIRKPAFKGQVRFRDVEFKTVNPKITFNVEDDNITLDNSSLLFDHFTLYDHQHHPLHVDGNVTTKDYQSLSYDLHVKGEDYTLLDKPDSANARLKGTLIIDTDIKLKGNDKDTNVEARLTIKDDTRLTFVNSSDDIELLTGEGIIEFIDPTLALDSTLEQSGTFYDSLIASLPDFNLNSTVAIEDDATIRIIIDEQSGDYIEASGGATLDMGYDRTGNLHLSGDYTIKQGVYRLSFYDLVKRNFTLAPGSSIHWSGSPEDGNLNIKAVHTVQSNSLGLIGHEIGENEKSIYKRSLNYEVGINIGGTLDKPIVSFSLDLPAEEKANYPVLANKLDRLRQPEFGSELNKQVFGLLVLGGFLPETSGDINSGVVATTALSNSVNALLASQLNRFASQYIKGVNIDVGIQSYSDYSAPGGKTQTAMDFRVSKRIMDDRLSFEVGGDFDINQDQSGANTGKNYRGDIAIIYDLTGNGDKQLKLFNNETYDIVYQEIRNTGISLIFVREFAPSEKKKRKNK